MKSPVVVLAPRRADSRVPAGKNKIRRLDRRARIGAGAALVATTLLWIRPADAWGPQGHDIVGRVAASQLCEEARQETARILGGRTLGDAGQWADRVRRRGRWRHSGPWHYINIPDGVALTDAPRSPEGDVVGAIGRFLEVLRDENASDAEYRDAMRFVIHFVADIHQPLHVGRAEDLGGNRIAIRVDGRRSNLHRFWDSTAVERSGQSSRQYARALVEELDRYEGAAVPGTVDLWVNEGVALRPLVYGFEDTGPDTVLDDEYGTMAAGIARDRLALAGLRLAAVLNAEYCPPEAPRPAD